VKEGDGARILTGFGQARIQDVRHRSDLKIFSHVPSNAHILLKHPFTNFYSLIYSAISVIKK
jgi:hypothetical protein